MKAAQTQNYSEGSKQPLPHMIPVQSSSPTCCQPPPTRIFLCPKESSPMASIPCDPNRRGHRLSQWPTPTTNGYPSPTSHLGYASSTIPSYTFSAAQT